MEMISVPLVRAGTVAVGFLLAAAGILIAHVSLASVPCGVARAA